MPPQRLPLAKLFDTPIISLDETSIELASILFLFLAVVVASSVRRRRQTVRHLVQLVSFVVFFFFIYSCLGVFGMIRNGLYGVTLIGTVYSESFYWMALPAVILAVTILFGPVFCGWVCPTGAIQELAHVLRQRLLGGARPRTRVEAALLGLSLAVFVALAAQVSVRKEMFVEDSSLHWAAALLVLCYLVVLGVVDDLPTRRLRLLSVGAIVVTAVSHVTITSPVHFAFTSRDDPASALSTLVIALAAAVVARAWCRYLCPWGLIMGVLQRFGRLRIARRSEVCHDCTTCAQICEVGAIDGRALRHEHCQFCFACIDACPRGALAVVDEWEVERRAGGRDPRPRLGRSSARG